MVTKGAATNGPGYERWSLQLTRSGHAQKTKGNVQRTGDEGTADGKQRNNRTEKLNRALEKGKIGRLIGLGDRERRMADKGQIK
jgi:hypothetical protein